MKYITFHPQSFGATSLLAWTSGKSLGAFKEQYAADCSPRENLFTDQIVVAGAFVIEALV